MKTFTFRFDPKASMDGMFDRFKEAAKSRKPQIRSDEMRSNSVAAMLSSMTAGRIELFYTIANSKPDSVYQVAQLLKRDAANVLRDVKILEGIGLVSLITEKDGGRERSRPVADYDRILFDFGAASKTDAA